MTIHETSDYWRGRALTAENQTRITQERLDRVIELLDGFRPHASEWWKQVNEALGTHVITEAK